MEKMESFSLDQILEKINDVFTHTLFTIGENKFSLAVILTAVLALIVLFFVSSKIEKIIIRIILSRSRNNIGTSKAIGTITRYVILVVGIIIIFQSLGIDMSTLTVLFGALGVGIGFGLQNIVNNFISGLIILFERPIKVGDRIEVGDVNGDVMDISARATTINTNDNITVIVPNSEFISSQVINWNHSDRNVRFRIPVGVSYKEDPVKIRSILLDVADKHPGVLKSPETIVLFDEYGDSSINFYLVVWTTNYINRPRILKSELYFEIFRRFREEEVEIPFPQRDLHLKSGFEKEKWMDTQQN
jgi:small-conductance mechanosensitive channel